MLVGGAGISNMEEKEECVKRRQVDQRGSLSLSASLCLTSVSSLSSYSLLFVTICLLWRMYCFLLWFSVYLCLPVSVSICVCCFLRSRLLSLWSTCMAVSQAPSVLVLSLLSFRSLLTSTCVYVALHIHIYVVLFVYVSITLAL